MSPSRSAEEELAGRIGGHLIPDRQQALDNPAVLAGGEVHLGGQDLGREQIGLPLAQLRRDAKRPLGVAGLQEVAPDVGQALPEVRADFAGIALEGIDQVRAVGRVQSQRLGSPLDGLPLGRRRRRGRRAGERRQQDGQEACRGDPSPMAFPGFRNRAARRKWWRWHACR